MLYLGKHWTNNLGIWSHWCQCNIFSSWCICGNVRAWGYLVKRDEGSYWPHNRLANLAIFLHKLSPLFWQFTNTTAHHLANTSLDFLVLVKICMIGSSLINMCHWELIMYRFIPNVGFRIFHCSCLSINLWGFWTSDSLIPFSASQYTYLPTYLPTYQKPLNMAIVILLNQITTVTVVQWTFNFVMYCEMRWQIH